LRDSPRRGEVGSPSAPLSGVPQPACPVQHWPDSLKPRFPRVARQTPDTGRDSCPFPSGEGGGESSSRRNRLSLPLRGRWRRVFEPTDGRACSIPDAFARGQARPQASPTRPAPLGGAETRVLDGVLSEQPPGRRNVRSPSAPLSKHARHGRCVRPCGGRVRSPPPRRRCVDYFDDDAWSD
jgi:hypothetical protein